MVCTNLQRTLYQSIHHQDMITFLSNRLSIDEQRAHTDLAWDTFRKARKECSFPMQKFISKWLSKTQQLAKSCNAGNNAFVIIAHAAEKMMNTFYMSLFALLTLQSTFENLCWPIWRSGYSKKIRNQILQIIFSPVCLLGLRIPLGLNLPFFVPTLPFDRQLPCNHRGSVGMHFSAAFLWNHWLPANKHITLPFNLADVVSAGQYASYIGAGKFFISFGCIGMRRYMNPMRIIPTGVRPIFQA